MSAYLTPLLHFQRFFLPGLFILLVWAIWRTVWRRDLAVGLALYLGLVIIVDGFLNTGIFLPGLEKGSIRYSEVCAFFLLINRPPVGPEQSPRRLVLFLVGLYFGLLFVSALRSDPMMAGIFEFRRLIITQIIALLVATRGLGSPENYRRFFLCLMSLVIIIGLFVFWDLFFDRWLLKSDMLFKPEYYVNRKHGRFGSFFLNPNYLGAFVVLIFPVAFIWTLNEHQHWVRLFAWTGLLALVFCLVETQSRGPLLVFGITLLMLVFGPSAGVSRTRRLSFLAVFTIIFTLLMPGFYERATKRFNSLDQEQTANEASRQTIWLYTKRIIADHPLGGIGFGEQQFLKATDAYGYAEQYSRLFDNPHNSYLQIAIYAGIPGLAVFLFANAALISRAVRVSLKDVAEGNTPAVFGLSIGITGFLACIYPDMHLFTQNVAPVYWVFFGLLLSLATRVPEVKPAKGSPARPPRRRYPRSLRPNPVAGGQSTRG
jgi:hypothetical protein